MQKILQQIKDDLERTYENPRLHDLDLSIQRIESCLELYGDHGHILENTITALKQARNARVALEQAGDVSSSAAFGQAFNALETAIKSYSDTNNDPYS